ncbi:MAG: DotU family type IV/VI secretion system protein [Muribaculaceae bacterium]|jgi:type VI protein secretion system component VasF|nr:DotU family type IV/VI secretion system protein [Muribaculaceae bacterium]MBQ1184882.1 DotU family type IV/VI secretion system protein [Muribaculaceae bacterium]MBQ2371209.1 DotU family type IV/VI secretion system protein [Muribaculaceae bacterium]MBQ2399397.1 DotU family type IV/VI secretion system protein [Muribaculaceae bacterium]MBQ5722898.1 DotU family type IV/VI secretion system protein [Muribaculaceae bacterium]
MKTHRRHNIDPNLYEQIKQEMIKAEREARMRNRQRKNRSTGSISRLWFWLGVLTLVLILLYWVLFIAVDFGINQ